MIEVCKILTNKYDSSVNLYLEKQQDSVTRRHIAWNWWIRYAIIETFKIIKQNKYCRLVEYVSPYWKPVELWK